MDAQPGLREARGGLWPRRHQGGRSRATSTGGLARGADGSADRLVFVDVITDQTENVFPMVPGGKGLAEMILAEEL